MNNINSTQGNYTNTNMIAQNSKTGDLGATNSLGDGLVGGLPVGSFISGEITDIVGNRVLIDLIGGGSLGARLSENMSANIGDRMILQVKENADNKLLLKTVSTYDAKSSLIANALKNAEMPENTKNIAIVNELIKNGQPINRETIQKVSMGLMTADNVDIDEVIDLVKHDIDINEENLKGYSQYKELNYSIIKEVNNFVDGFTDKISLIKENAIKVIDVLTSDFANLDETFEKNESHNPSPENLITENKEINNTNLYSELKSENKATTLILDTKNQTDIIEKIKVDLPKADTSKLEQLLKTDNPNEILKEINKIYKNESTVPAEILKADPFKELIKEIVLHRWTLDAKEFNNSEDKLSNIKELYAKIINDTEELENILKTNPNTKDLANSLSNIKADASFANQLNNIVSYVQLPLKFNEGSEHGDLYVYNNKKQKYIPGDLITAHLYLELEHLGATDVHISMQGKSTSTNFVLEDDLSMQIVEEHMPELIKRLENKGYSCTYKVETINKKFDDNKGNTTNPFDEILSKDTNVLNIKRYNFDVRA